MVTRWGMSDELDMVALAPRENAFIGDGAPGYWSAEKPYSEKTAEKIDAEVERIIGGSHEEARQLLAEHRGELDALARALLERETLEEEEILAVTGLPRAPRLADGKQPVSHVSDANPDR
jgi:cell division protease FtsH